MGMTYCTPIQADSLPYSLAGKDIADKHKQVQGKPLPFNSTFQKLIQEPASHHTLSAIILAPTRELAVQIYHDAQHFAQTTGLKLGLAYGGDGYDKQLQALQQGVNILIGTTGRVIDYMKQRIISLDHVQVVVLDEADRMFDLGFIRDIRYILRHCPPPSERLTMLFSATLSFKVRELAFEDMNDPHYIEIESMYKTADTIKEELFYPLIRTK